MIDAEPPTLGSLRDRRVLVTRAAGQEATLAARLVEAGAEPVAVPLIQIEPAAVASDIRRSLERLHGHRGERWVAFTSANAVDMVTAAIARPGDLGGITVVALGERTAAALVAWGRPPDVMSDSPSGEGVAAAMRARGLAGSAVWLPRGDLAGDLLPTSLAGAGAAVEPQIVYRTVVPRDAAERLAAAMPVAAVTLTSPSTARNFAAALGGRTLDGGTLVACLGPVTAQAAVDSGLRVDATAPGRDVAALVAALGRALAGC